MKKYNPIKTAWFSSHKDRRRAMKEKRVLDGIITRYWIFTFIGFWGFISFQAIAQDDLVAQFESFDETAEGPWSDLERTTLTVPKVPNYSITLDGNISSAEYGNFEGVEVIPVTNGWVLTFANAKEWTGPEDSSFTFYLAYDDTYFYVAVNVKDDVIQSNDYHNQFWKDDAIEMVLSPYPYKFEGFIPGIVESSGGQTYVNFEGIPSGWKVTGTERTEGEREAAGPRWADGEPWILRSRYRRWSMEWRRSNRKCVDDGSAVS
jgi:hypothetical protein